MSFDDPDPNFDERFERMYSGHIGTLADFNSCLAEHVRSHAVSSHQDDEVPSSS